jgi:hypothetical protein
MWWRLKQVAMLAMCGVLAGCGGSSGGGSTYYTVGGTVSGLTAGSLVLQNNNRNNLSISSNGSFTFSSGIADGSNYAVTVLSQPAGQFCSVSNGTGTLNAMNVSYVAVSCVTSCVLGTDMAINVSGRITFDRVHHASGGSLDYSHITQDPVRGAVVEAMCNNSLVTSTSTDINGDYSVTVPGGTDNLLLRVKAQMLQTSTASWNFRVIDNTAGGALYALTSSVFNTGADNLVLDLNAASGWAGTAYTATRAAAPFAILDSVYDAFRKVLAENATTQFPALNLNWSVNNVDSSGNVAIGQIGTSYFLDNEIFILGAANSDTDEYDDHVVIHEWGHYFEYNFSRADNIGGSHSLGDVLDIRVAFGEGFGNAYSAIASDDPIYADANGPLQASGFTINMEANCPGVDTNRGWYSECSVQSILYDLYDGVTGDADALTMGFTPLYNVLVNQQKNTPAMTSIFSFIHALKQNNTSSVTDINALLEAQSIDGSLLTDIYGSGQVTNNSGSADALPVYKLATVGGAAVNVCSSSEFQVYNGYEVSRFIKFNLPGPQSLLITAVKTASTGTGRDPDLVLYRNGAQIAIAETTVLNSETLSVSNLSAGDYVLELYDYGNRDTGVGSTCYNVTL